MQCLDHPLFGKLCVGLSLRNLAYGNQVPDLVAATTRLEELMEWLPPTPESVIVCVRCSHVLADAADTHEILGSVEHEFVNPFGVVHHFRCYGHALGCATKGRAHHADTWFPGYRWKIATCGNCDDHLGWFFEASDSFYGLLTAKIVTQSLDASQ